MFKESKKDLSEVLGWNVSCNSIWDTDFWVKSTRFFFTNSVKWMTNQAGVHFSKYGIAFTKPLMGSRRENFSDLNGFSLEIALKPANSNKGRFGFILAIHSGDDSEQLVIGQWRSWIILMNGDDYNHRRKTKRISVNMAELAPKVRFLTIITGEKGTDVYLDGRLFVTKKDLTLKVPSGGKARLILGNSVYGKHSWKGDVHGLALYRHTLTAQDAELHFYRWFKEQSFSFALQDKPFVLYLFDEKSGTRALDYAGGSHHVEIPSIMKVLEKKILALPWRGIEFHRLDVLDMIVNLAGFIPFGFVLSATLAKIDGPFKKYSILLTVVLGFLVSLFIEIIQAWLPSRSSHFFDLTLNTLGTLIGAMICIILTMQACGKIRNKG